MEEEELQIEFLHIKYVPLHTFNLKTMYLLYIYIYTSIVTVCYRMCRYILYTSSILHQRQQSGENPMESVTTSCLKLFSTPRHSSLWQSLAIVHRTLGNNQFLVAEPLNTSSNMSLFAPANAASRQALLSLRCFLRRSWTGL